MPTSDRKSSPRASIDPDLLQRNEEGVDYVVVGGVAAVVRESSPPTRDIDIVPSRSSENLDGPFLANMPLMPNLVTAFGEMDLTFVPAGRAGGLYGWRPGATEEEVSDGLTVVFTSLDDIIDSKRAANRPKDQMALP